MDMTRRHWLSAVAALPAALPAKAKAATAQLTALPARTAFATTDIAYLDNGSQHPVSLGAKAAIDAYFAKRMLDPAAMGYKLDDDGLRAKFARLINADPDEISFVQSTTAGEQAVIRALDLPDAGGHVVTETLHFFGSFALYEDLSRRGVDVSWVRAVNGRIRLEDIKAAIHKGTKLVALSQVSTVNGFEHDLKAICDHAHAHGALVYADIIHAAGCVPLDVRASGVDFAACASYKWLMGDFGLGFLYVRKDLLPRLTRRNWGYYGISNFATHVYPLDAPGNTVHLRCWRGLRHWHALAYGDRATPPFPRLDCRAWRRRHSAPCPKPDSASARGTASARACNLHPRRGSHTAADRRASRCPKETCRSDGCGQGQPHHVGKPLSSDAFGA